MRRVNERDLKVGAEIHWFENGRKYIIEKVSLNEVKFRGFKPNDIQLVLKHCFISTKTRIENMYEELESIVMMMVNNPNDQQLKFEYRSKKVLFIEEIKRLEALDAK